MIKKLTLIAILAISSFAMDYNLKATKIATNVFMFNGVNEVVTAQNGGNIANTFWVKTKNHFVVIDSGASYQYAKQAHDAMKKIANLPIKFVVNTHMHDDHWMGNNYYKELNIPIYATALQQKTFKIGGKTRIMNKLKSNDLKGTKIVTIDKLVNKNFSVTVDGDKFEFILFPYPAHTKEDFIVNYNNGEVLFSGDLLFSQRITSIRDGSIEGSLKTLKFMRELNPKVWANGHGKFTDKTALIHMENYLGDLKKAAMDAIEEDLGLDEFVKNADFSKYKDMKLFKQLNSANLDNAFREYEFFEEE